NSTTGQVNGVRKGRNTPYVPLTTNSGVLSDESNWRKRTKAELFEQPLTAIFEADFSDVSYGFRPQRGAHDALKTLNHLFITKKINLKYS
ncbi:MAG: hypothetical protein OWT27_08695, partial [Firmicutes bacterium]|nr:hypothetical protein [Bacillota bacterium]